MVKESPRSAYNNINTLRKFLLFISSVVSSENEADGLGMVGHERAPFLEYLDRKFAGRSNDDNAGTYRERVV